MKGVDELERQILELIDRLFSVTTVDPETTKAILQRLVEEIEIKIEALEP